MWVQWLLTRTGVILVIRICLITNILPRSNKAIALIFNFEQIKSFSWNHLDKSGICLLGVRHNSIKYLLANKILAILVFNLLIVQIQMSKMHIIMMQYWILLHKISEDLFTFIFKLRLDKSHEVLLKFWIFAYCFLDVIQICLMRLRVAILSHFILALTIFHPLFFLFLVLSLLLLFKIFLCLLVQLFNF